MKFGARVVLVERSGRVQESARYSQGTILSLCKVRHQGGSCLHSGNAALRSQPYADPSVECNAGSTKML